MAYTLEEVVEATGESEAEILRKGVESSVERELREARIRVDELRETYESRRRPNSKHGLSAATWTNIPRGRS